MYVTYVRTRCRIFKIGHNAMIIDYSSTRGEQETEVATHVSKQEVFERRDLYP